MKTWKNITLELPNLDLQLASDILFSLEILSITILDKQNESDSEWFDDPNNPLLLTGNTHKLVLLIHSRQDVNRLISDIMTILNLKESPSYHEEIFEDIDWVTHTQSQFKEIIISNSLRIVPPWKTNSAFTGHTIIIQPGSGFGTGSHPTTQLCLKWLENNLKGKESILDYGCGWGILSIGAMKIGANFAEGVELDPLAIQNAKQNNELNNLSIPFHHPDTFKAKEKYDIVIANILANILMRLSPIIGPLFEQNLVLSGILESQAKHVIQNYSQWGDLSVQDEMDGWVLLSNTSYIS